ncbi:hypothetical protein RJP56_18845 [Shewanella baltica]|uniref:Uncharacterized protein n=1 Tax=Shewanella scandinavica TaxID=3063538 RepID=A0ABU3FYL5_9GAMM|nr:MULTISPECIES: hypothetical protein [Shewanella]MCS6128875.1 hypothetical protein [Shewanella baltica]MCS6140805.1 hypothetical protein [Shewanella baltica]MCS6147089.1 hypothetical protein [Shewanella baltica]MCS6171618.1 hypothetical protein [Shewanella baltica]MCS6176757.1 hypothetical protein [Shewanella baltica]
MADLEKIKMGGAGGSVAIIIYFLASMNNALVDMGKTVSKNDSRLNVIEYRLDKDK